MEKSRTMYKRIVNTGANCVRPYVVEAEKAGEHSSPLHGAGMCLMGRVQGNPPDQKAQILRCGFVTYGTERDFTCGIEYKHQNCSGQQPVCCGMRNGAFGKQP